MEGSEEGCEDGCEEGSEEENKAVGPAWLSLTRRLTELCFIINVCIIITYYYKRYSNKL